MHKSEEYGKIYVKEKDICRTICPGKTSGKYGGKLSAFAKKLARHLPYSTDEIESGLEELLDEGVLTLEGNCISQKRMIKDAEISEKRALSGKKGAIATNNKSIKPENNNNELAENFAPANSPANTENEIEIENNTVIEIKKGGKSLRKEDPEIIEVEVIEDPEFASFEEWIKNNAPRVAKMKEPFTADQYYRITSEYPIDEIKATIEQMHNYKNLKTISAYLTCRNWLNRDREKRGINPGTPAGKGSKINDALGAVAGALMK